MKELLTNTISDVYYDIFKNGILTDATGNVTVSLYKNGVKLIDSAVATKITGNVGKYSYTLPVTVTVGSSAIGIVTEEGEIELDWTFSIGSNTLTIKDFYSVVIPYSPWSYFNDVGTISYADYLECERVSRYIINSYCGQAFGLKNTTFAIEGNGTDSLRLPWRLIALTDINWIDKNVLRPGRTIGSPNPIWEIGSDGWMLRYQPNRITIDPVYNPASTFSRNMLYNVQGVWGYTGVPGPIEEASKILTANYICQDHKYRDKYLQSIKMGDWRIQFHDLAFVGTGDATVDKLLVDYRVYPGVGII